MHGGAWEYVMGNMIGNDGKTMISGLSATGNSGYTGITYSSGSYTSYIGTYSYPDSKYYDKYSFGITYKDSNALKRLKLGDGTKEIIDISIAGVIQSSYPWFARGNVYNTNTENNIFATGRVAGNATASGNLRSTRTIYSILS